MDKNNVFHRNENELHSNKSYSVNHCITTLTLAKQHSRKAHKKAKEREKEREHYLAASENVVKLVVRLLTPPPFFLFVLLFNRPVKEIH